MEFKVRTSGWLYNQKDVERLQKIGFTFDKPSEGPGYCIKGEPVIDIKTIEELVEFTNVHGDIIVNGNSIEIYDDYIE